MPRKNGRKAPAKKRTYFRISAPSATEVHLVGDFNEWDPAARLLRKDPKGVWKTSMMLPPGAYEYRFFVDGAWKNDGESLRVPNAFGSSNCLRVVG